MGWVIESMAMPNKVVVTGLGVLAANGIGLAAFWASLLAGRSGVGPVTLFDTTVLPCRIAGEIKDLDPLHFMSPAQKPRRMGRFTQLALAAAKMAFEQAVSKSCASRVLCPTKIFIFCGMRGLIFLNQQWQSSPSHGW